MLGVAHHDAARRRNAVALAEPRDGEPRQGVAILGLLAERREGEAALETEAPELDLPHLGHVPGEQAHHPARLALDGVEQRGDAGHEPAARRHQEDAHAVEDGIPERRLVAVQEVPAVLVEDVAQDARLGAAGEGDVGERVVHPEPIVQGGGKGLAGRPLGGEERAIHVEEPGEAGRHGRKMHPSVAAPDMLA